jgi:hypothetical protein
MHSRNRQDIFGRLVAAAGLCLICFFTPARAAELKGKTVDAWDRYVRFTEERSDSELRSAQGFLARDFLPIGESSEARAAVRRGEILVSQMKTHAPDGADIPVPSGMISHWLGSIFIPNAQLSDILAHVQREGAKDHRQEDVIESRVLARDGDSMRIYLRLTRSKIVTVTYNTEHMVRYQKHDDRRASSRSVSLHIAEVEHANTRSEREKPEGMDNGFLWRLNSYWRYEQASGGVFVECESVSLSRSIPFGLAPLVRPIINSIARESMSRTLSAMRQRFTLDQRAEL